MCCKRVVEGVGMCCKRVVEGVGNAEVVLWKVSMSNTRYCWAAREMVREDVEEPREVM